MASMHKLARKAALVVPAGIAAPVLSAFLLAPQLGFARSRADGAQNGRIVSVKDYSNVADALNAVPPGGTLILPSDYTAVVSAGLVVKTRGVSIHCDPGAKLIRHGSFTLLLIEADNVTVEGCALDGANASGDEDNVLAVRNVSHFRLAGLTIENSYGTGISLFHASDGLINYNSISGMKVGDGIFGEGETSKIIVESNLIDRSTAIRHGHAIGFHSTTTGVPTSQVTVANNNIYNGFGWCVEFGSFGSGPSQGSLVREVVVDGNNCTQAPPMPGEKTWGGYSFAGTEQIAVTGNVYDNDVGNGLLMGIEVTAGARANITGNTIWGADADFNDQSYSVFSSNNIFSVFPSAGRANSGFYLGGSASGMDSDFDSVEGNLISRTAEGEHARWVPRQRYAPGTIITDQQGELEIAVSKHGLSACASGTSAPSWKHTQGGYTRDNECEWRFVAPASPTSVEYAGIWLQCNGSEGATCEHNQIRNNTIIDNEMSQRPAIILENDSAESISSDIIVAGNQLVGWKMCYSTNSGMGTTYIYDNDEGCQSVGVLAGKVFHATSGTIAAHPPAGAIR